MNKKYFIFVLPPEEVTTQGRNHIKKSYRQNNQEVESIYQSEQLFQNDFDEEMDGEIIFCFSFKRVYFIQMTQWIEKMRSKGFTGKILLSITSGTFDYASVPKFLAAGGSFVIDEEKWKHDPLVLCQDNHSECIQAWLQNRKKVQDTEVLNEDAVEYLYNELLGKDSVDFKTLSYVYEGLSKKHRENLLTLLRKKYRRWNRRIFQRQEVDFSGEGIVMILGNPEFSAELAVRIALEKKKKVLLVDLDRLNPSLDFYCPRKSEKKKSFKKDLSEIQRLYSQNKIGADDYREVYASVPKVSSLKVIYGCNDLKKFEYFTNEALIEALAVFRRSFDVVIISGNTFIYDAYTCIGIIKADMVLLPVNGQLATLRHYRRSMDLLCEKQKVNLEKCCYVFFECEEHFSGEMQLMTEMVNGPVAGWIGKCKKRQHYRNLRKAYATNMSIQSKKDYQHLLDGLNL